MSTDIKSRESFFNITQTHTHTHTYTHTHKQKLP